MSLSVCIFLQCLIALLDASGGCSDLSAAAAEYKSASTTIIIHEKGLS